MEVRLCLMGLFQAVVFIIIKVLSTYIGEGFAKVIVDMISSFLGGGSMLNKVQPPAVNVVSNGQGSYVNQPMIERQAQTTGPLPYQVTQNSNTINIPEPPVQNSAINGNSIATLIGTYGGMIAGTGSNNTNNTNTNGPVVNGNHVNGNHTNSNNVRARPKYSE